VSEPARGRRLEIITGGIAAGKTQSIQQAIAHPQAIVWETPLRDPKLAEEIIRQAAQNGWEVNVRYIHRPMGNVLPAYLARIRNEGRWSHLTDVLKSHRESQKSVVQLRRALGHLPNVGWTYLKNDGTRDNPRPLQEVSEIEVAAGGNAWHSTSAEHEHADENLAQSLWRQAVASGQLHPETFGQIALPDRGGLPPRGEAPGGTIQADHAPPSSDS